jgi:DNA-binding FadR family transcriptional regulator
MTNALDQLPRYPTLVTNVVDRLQQYLREAKLQEGDRLPSQEELATRLGVSRTVIREAVKGLETLGVVESRRGDGVFVASFNAKPLANSMALGLQRYSVDQRLRYLFEAREQFEKNAMVLAVKRISEDDRRRIEDILAQMRTWQGDNEGSLELDYQFHSVLLEASGNPIVAWFGEIIHELFSLLAEYRHPSSSEYYNLLYTGHKQIYEAICQGDVNAVCKAVTEHIANSRQRWLAPSAE